MLPLLLLWAFLYQALAEDSVLFAIVGGSSCSELLKYGPQALTTAGSADGNAYYLATNTTGKNIAHTEWTQIVTSSENDELFRIYWSFAVPKTLANRFIGATTAGETVSYRVVTRDPAQEYTYSAKWWFSSTASITANKFQFSSTQTGFSADDGVWGAGSGTLNANANANGYSATSFWGMDNWNADDSGCSKIYRAGVASTTAGTGTKSFMSYSSTPPPTATPTAPVPSVNPSISPTQAPNIAPSMEPTAAPTASPTVDGDALLFAVVGGTSCADALYYGPQAITIAGSADGLRPYFLSTNTAARNVAHTNWLQIVTSDGVTELFRIYWVFNTPKTLAQRFAGAVSVGEAVSYRVVDAETGLENVHSGTWRYSSTAAVTTAKFDVLTTTYGFSADDGAWGGGTGIINGNGNGYTAAAFWGIGNWDAADSTECYKVYRAGVPSTAYGTSVKSFMYYHATPQPSAAPTLTPTRPPSCQPTKTPTREPTSAPTRAPTCQPTKVPTSAPTMGPTVGGDPILFAVVGGTSCAEALYYGPQAITAAGSADGLRPYFLSTNTVAKTGVHTNWLQIVTSDGVTELFRIYWVFNTPKTLAQRFAGAVSSGEAVSYRVVEAGTGTEYAYSGTWRFSNSAGITTSKFDVSTSTYGFSADDGAWGAGSGTVDANGSGYTAASFWGIGTWDSADSSECYKIYRAGVASTTAGTGVKVFMYYHAPTWPTTAPTTAPTTPTCSPSETPSKPPSCPPTATPTRDPSCVPTRSPSPQPTLVPTKEPTLTPTRAPSCEPTKVPTREPTVTVTVGGDPILFAVVGGTSCAETLYYGPQAITSAGAADGTKPYFLSTSTAAKNVAHTNWLQIVTSDGVTELFRIYWVFSVPRTLAQHFAAAVGAGVDVSYRVVEASAEQEYTYSGTWRFSSSALITGAKFDVLATSYGFSSDDGAWGAGSGAVNGNGAVPASFWGIGNFDNSDNVACYTVYRAGVASSIYGTGVKSFMYYHAPTSPTTAPTIAPTTPTCAPSETPTRTPSCPPTITPTREPTLVPTRSPSCQPTKVPTKEPTCAPTRSPSCQPTRAPTQEPTVAATIIGDSMLFAVVGGTSCAETLYYGPQAITSAGAADGTKPYFLSTNTAARNVAHTNWLQIVTSDGVTELFRIYWVFNTPKTLALRFVGASSVGEAVSYRVVEAGTGTEYSFTGTWRFSSSATIYTSKFEVTTTTYGFSADDGAWGAGSGVIDGNSQGYTAASFWGVGTWDSSDAAECYKVYRAGVASTAYGTGVKSFMYYDAPSPPTAAPSTVPTTPTCLPSEAPSTLVPSPRPTRTPSCQPTKAPTIEPTLTPTRTPSCPPSRVPTKDPTFAPTRAPSCQPTRVPTAAPSMGFEVPPSMELFAIVGGSSCSENLFYGPQSITVQGSADGLRPYFLSTNTASKAVAHSYWLQVVTSNGNAELFRIYWTFATPRTLSQHFAVAVTTGESVTYRVVETSTGADHTYTATWRFSNGAGDMSAKFETSTTQNGFSADDGAWGAGSGTIDANGGNQLLAAFWGLGNWDAGDSECSKVYQAGSASNVYGTGVKSYMYYSAIQAPTTLPTFAPSNPTAAPSATVAPSRTPTRNPTKTPTKAPTRSPTKTPTRNPTARPTSKPTAVLAPAPSGALLFAVIGGTSCSETLYYGPQAITAAGSADGQRPYFLSTDTAAKDVPHNSWLQIVTSDGTTELFRIYWTFDTSKTLAERFVGAASSGERVSYNVQEVGHGYGYIGTWWFSSSAAITASKFTTTATQSGFSADDGAWGGGSGTIDGNGAGYTAASFWGIGNWDAADSSECSKVYRNGVASTAYGTGVKSYMYYFATPTPARSPTFPPTYLPTRKPTSGASSTGTISVGSNYELFAIVGGSSCAETLRYGPEKITLSGASNGVSAYYLSTGTTSKDLPHTEWLQVVTSDGVTELFRIYWSFATAKTLAQHFVDAVQTGESVTYRVESVGFDYYYTGIWRFSSASGLTANAFAGQQSGVLSADDGAWGAGAGTVDGNAVASTTFWGQGNFDSSDVNECLKVYSNGVPSAEYGYSTKSFLYYQANREPTAAPTASPQVTFKVEQEIQGISYADYAANQYMSEIVLKLAIADSMDGVTPNDIYNFIVTAAGASTNGMLLDSPPATSDSSAGAARVSPKLRSNPRPLASSDAIKTSYTIQVIFAGLTYADLSAQLASAVSTGTFNTQLHSHAAEQGVPAFANATSTAVQTEEVVASDDGGSDSSSTSMPMIIGLAAGGFCILLVALLIYYFVLSRPASVPAEGTTAQPPGLTPSVDPSLAKDINSYFYGGGIPSPQNTEQAMIPTAPPDSHDNLGIELRSSNEPSGSPPPAPPPPPMRITDPQPPAYEQQQVKQSNYSADPSAPSDEPSGGPYPAPAPAPGPVSAPVPVSRPVPAVAVPVAALASPSYHYGDGEIVIAEVYVGEIEEEFKE